MKSSAKLKDWKSWRWLSNSKREGPEIHGALELRDNPNGWAVRFDNGKYRMLYRVSKGKSRITIFRMQPRDIVYKGLRGYYEDLRG